MIQSMTGYAKNVLKLATKNITIEIKSLNSKNLDLNIRIPHLYKDKELYMRSKIVKCIQRGKVDLSIYVEPVGSFLSSKINTPAVKAYMEELKLIDSTISSKNLLKMAINLPDALKMPREELDSDEWDQINKTFDCTLSDILTYRKYEGNTIEIELKKQIEKIIKLLDKTLSYESERINIIKNRLRKALDELKVTYDNSRFEQELFYYLEKLDVSEEKIRLKNHLDFFLNSLNTTDYSNGKKLGFIIQEISREINTIGSKSNYAPMQRCVVKMKDELEKIKEQILNVL